MELDLRFIRVGGRVRMKKSQFFFFCLALKIFELDLPDSLHLPIPSTAMAFVDTEMRLSSADLQVCCGFVPQLQGHHVDIRQATRLPVSCLLLTLLSHPSFLH